MRTQTLITTLVLSLIAGGLWVNAQESNKPYFGDELNNLLEIFFENEGTIPSGEPVNQFEIPDELLPEDRETIETEIELETASLDEFTSKLESERANLWELQSEQRTVENQLRSLDAELGILERKVNRITEQKKYWQEELNQITREKSDIRALGRHLIRTFQRSQRQAFLRSQNFGSDDTGMMLQWLMSDQTSAQILEKRRQSRLQTSQQKNLIAELETHRTELQRKEAKASLIFAEIKALDVQLTQDRNTLVDLTQAKANLITRLSQSLSDAERNLEIYQNQQALSEQTLIALREKYIQKEKEELEAVLAEANRDTPLDAIDNTGEETPTEPEGFLWPLPETLERKITAEFDSTRYQAQFGKSHKGLDIYAPQGTPLLAVADGTIIDTHEGDYDFSSITIDHGGDLLTLYGHVSEIQVVEGDEIKRGQQIGLSGGTPGAKGSGYFTSGPHLHFEVFDQGQYKDPLEYLPMN